MDVVWDRDAPSTVADIHVKLNSRGRRISYSAVKAVMLNLTEKRLLGKSKAGRSNVFHSLVTRSDFEGRLVSGVLSSLFKNYRGPLLAHFVDELTADDEAIAEFERLLSAKESKRNARE